MITPVFIKLTTTFSAANQFGKIEQIRSKCRYEHLGRTAHVTRIYRSIAMQSSSVYRDIHARIRASR